jgi:hypothetical protein
MATAHSSTETEREIKTQEQVEKLVSDIGGAIRAAEPAQRAALKDLAETLLHEEFATIAETNQTAETEPRRRTANPLAAGILLFLIGLGFLMITPPIGATLVGIGALLVAAGAVMSWMRK